MEELKSNHNFELNKLHTVGTFKKLKQNSESLDLEIQRVMSSMFGVEGIGYANLHMIYDPIRSGNPSLLETRRDLMKKGMSADFADNLAARYLRQMEQSENTICTIIQLF